MPPVAIRCEKRYQFCAGAAQVIAGRRPEMARAAGGKSELRRAECQLTAGGGDPKESATESKPPRRVLLREAPRGKGERVR
jgi:hypothetical protein